MSGSLRQRSKSGDAWELKFEAPADPATGERKTVHRTFRGTKRQAQARLVELQSEAARGGLVDHSRETLGEFLIRWDRDWVAHQRLARRRASDGTNWRSIRSRRALAAHRCSASSRAILAELYATLMREGGVGGGPLAAGPSAIVIDCCAGRSATR